MAEVEYSTSARLPVAAIWDFVREMDNWAPFLTGYQGHHKESDTESVWTLKGDVGSLTRTLKFQVTITEWAGPDRVSFELEGLNEQMSGSGHFLMESYEAGSSAAEGSAPTPTRGFFARLVERVMRFFFRRVHGRAERGEAADAGPGAGMAKLSFRLRLDPGGPMAPMINAMMRPAMLVAAEDLANKIVGHLEAEREPGA